jgi:hypothetical protein
MALALSLAVASAQTAAPKPEAPAIQPTQVASPPAEPALPPSRRPGFLHALGDWFGHSISSINSRFKSAGQAAKGVASTAGEVAKGTASTLIRLPGTRMVDGRQRCMPAPNGAPDCYAAATALCRSKGFRDGKSVETQATRNCPVLVWLQGSSAGKCTTETFVTRAVCN